MQLVMPSPAMMADLRKRRTPMIADFMKRVPAAEKPIKAYLAEVKRGVSARGRTRMPGAPPPLRPLLDGIDVLGRLDGWLGFCLPRCADDA